MAYEKQEIEIKRQDRKKRDPISGSNKVVLLWWYFDTSIHDALDDQLNIDKKDKTYHYSCFVYRTNI